MTNNLKIEVLVSNIPEDGSIASQFPSQEYVNQQLAKKASLSPEGRLDPSHAPDYTEIPGLYEHIEDTKDAIETSIADSLQDAKGYTNQQLSEGLRTKADLVNGKIPFDQIPFSADIEDQIQINVENITAVVDQKVAQVVGQVNAAATAANAYTDTKVAENKTYVDNTIGNVIEDVERLGVSKAVTIPTYLTPESGVAVGTGVAAGAYFNVRSTDDDTVAIEYQNVGGVPTPTGKSHPNANASSISTANGETQQGINDYNGVKWRNKVDGYVLNARVMLENGDIVKSTVAGNTVDPNVDMTGWVNETEELYVFRKPVIYAKNIKTDGTDQLSLLNAYAAEAVSKKLTLVLPAGVISIADEFIPPDSLVIESSNSSATGAGSGNSSGTVIKWIGANGIGKSVVRASTAAVGVEPTAAKNGVQIRGIAIDATGCDFGFYARYLTNESYVDSLYVRGASVCNIWGAQLWFCNFGRLLSQSSKGVGICFGHPLAAETGDLAVNAVNFQSLRAHSSGTEVAYNYAVNKYAGAGIILDTEGCSYTSIQSEANNGIGLIDKTNIKSNFYGAFYLENNTKNYTSRISYLNEGSQKVINSVTLSSGQIMINNGGVVSILNGSNSSATKCLSGSGKFKLLNNSFDFTRGLTSNELADNVFYELKSIISWSNVNIKYSGDLLTAQNFASCFNVGYPFLVIYPISIPSSNANIVIDFNGVEHVIPVISADVQIGKPIIKRLNGVITGNNTFRISDPIYNTAFNCNVQIIYGEIPDGDFAERIKIGSVVG